MENANLSGLQALSLVNVGPNDASPYRICEILGRM